VSATGVPEREWKRLFIIRSSPAKTASWAYMFWLNSQPVKFRTGLRREIRTARQSYAARATARYLREEEVVLQ